MPITITLHFRGLICHVGPDQNHKTHAALIHDPGVHDPLLTIGGTTKRLTKGDVITFHGLPPGPADSSDNDFEDTVPHLEDVTNGAIDHFIQNRLDHNDVVAYVVYPEGDLTVDEWFPEQARYQLKVKALDKTQCVADITTLKSTSTNSTVDVFVNKILVKKLTANTQIDITNMSDGGHHFQLHKKLTDAKEIASVTAASRCPKSSTSTLGKTINQGQPSMRSKATGVPPSPPDPECSNSQWP